MKYPIKATWSLALFLAVLTVALMYLGERLLQQRISLPVFDRIVWGNSISPVILVLFFTALYLLLGKRYRLRRDRVIGGRFLSDIGPRLYDNKTSIDDVTEHASRYGDSIIGQRWNRYHVIRGTAEVEAIEQQLAHTDLEHLQNSYAMIRFVVWSLPIVGFIGTVWGIGLSISFFSDTMSSGQAGAGSVSTLLQQNIPLVTKGLSTAFDTTLLALVLSIPATGLMVATERNERDYLADLDERWRRFIALSRPRIRMLTDLDISLDEAGSRAQLQAVDESLRDLREGAFEQLKTGSDKQGDF